MDSLCKPISKLQTTSKYPQIIIIYLFVIYTQRTCKCQLNQIMWVRKKWGKPT